MWSGRFFINAVQQVPVRNAKQADCDQLPHTLKTIAISHTTTGHS